MSRNLRNLQAKVRLDDLIHQFGRPLGQYASAFWRLIGAVRSTSNLLTAADTPSRHHRVESQRLAAACLLAAVHSDRWVRAPETWIPVGQSRRVQLRSLLEHLFAKYPVPAFSASAWLSGVTWEIELYLHLALGLSVRCFPSPYSWELTKSGARSFMQAPDDLPPSAAFRWAQVKSLGGDSHLARTLVKTLLGEPTVDEPFWATVVQFLISNGPIQSEEVTAIVYFVQRQRFEPAEIVWGAGAGQQPLQPEFSLAGWSLSDLRQHIANWQEELGCRMSLPTRERPELQWVPMQVEPFVLRAGDQCWTIRELLTPSELQIEGGIMRHCVGRYVSACRHRRTSIWSMRVETKEVQKRVLTIEVQPKTRLICQAKGRANTAPCPISHRILQLWAVQAGLQIDGSITAAARH